MARRDTRSAHRDYLLGLPICERLRPTLAQFVRRQEAALSVKIRHEGMVASTGDVARDRVDGLVLACEAVGAARIDQHRRTVCQPRLELLDGHRLVGARVSDKGCRRDARVLGIQRKPGGDPCFQSTVENRRGLVTQPAQHPPEASGDCAAGIVIGNNLGAPVDAPRAEPACEHIGGGQRMPTRACSNRAGQVLVQMRIAGARDVATAVSLTPGFRFRQVEAAIDDYPRRISEMSRHLGGLDDSGEAHAGILQSLRCRARGSTAEPALALDLYWGSGSPYSWRVMLALEHKRLPYASHPLEMSLQEHKAPHMLKLNPRGQLPVLKDGDYVCFESLAILYYLDLKYPDPPLFGSSPEEAGTIMRVICEYQNNAEPQLMKFVRAVFTGKVRQRMEEVTDAMHILANEARVIEGRLSKSDWIVGEHVSALD